MSSATMYCCGVKARDLCSPVNGAGVAGVVAAARVDDGEGGLRLRVVVCATSQHNVVCTNINRLTASDVLLRLHQHWQIYKCLSRPTCIVEIYITYSLEDCCYILYTSDAHSLAA